MTHRRSDLKPTRGYVIPATEKEDSGGVDLWVKMPRDVRLLPVQVTQRGIRLFRKHRKHTSERLEDFMKHSEERIRKKQRRCRTHGIAFVLVRDYDGRTTNKTLAWGDVKALRYAIAHLKRWL